MTNPINKQLQTEQNESQLLLELESLLPLSEFPILVVREPGVVRKLGFRI